LQVGLCPLQGPGRPGRAMKIYVAKETENISWLFVIILWHAYTIIKRIRKGVVDHMNHISIETHAIRTHKNTLLCQNPAELKASSSGIPGLAWFDQQFQRIGSLWALGFSLRLKFVFQVVRCWRCWYLLVLLIPFRHDRHCIVASFFSFFDCFSRKGYAHTHTTYLILSINKMQLTGCNFTEYLAGIKLRPRHVCPLAP
jgi:hypothetical protein